MQVWMEEQGIQKELLDPKVKDLMYSMGFIFNSTG